MQKKTTFRATYNAKYHTRNLTNKILVGIQNSLKKWAKVAVKFAPIQDHGSKHLHNFISYQRNLESLDFTYEQMQLKSSYLSTGQINNRKQCRACIKFCDAQIKVVSTNESLKGFAQLPG